MGTDGTYDSSNTTGTLPALGVFEVGIAIGSTIRVACSSRSIGIEFVGVGSSASGGSTGTGRLVLVSMLVKVAGLVEAGTSGSIRVSVVGLDVSMHD